MLFVYFDYKPATISYQEGSYYNDRIMQRNYFKKCVIFYQGALKAKKPDKWSMKGFSIFVYKGL